MTKEEFTRRVDVSGLTKKEFAEKADIAYTTVSNWNNDSKPVPSWVESWLDNYAKAQAFEAVASAVKPYIV